MADVATQALDKLKSAKEKLEGGWTKGTYHETTLDGQHLFCAMGAFYEACSVDYTFGEGQYIIDAGSAALHTCLPEDFDTVIGFNDSQDSVEPVLDLYDCAIEKMEKETQDAAG